SDGTVGANKNSIKIIGDTTDKYCQAYFAYDSKKSGGFTSSHLRFGNDPIRSPYLVNAPDFVACHVPAYINQYDVLKGLKKGGSFLLNSIWSVEETKNRVPDHMKKYMANNDINFYIINATEIAEEIGLGTRTNTIMQSAFFNIAEVIPYDQAVEQMKKFIVKSYGMKGENIVNMNYAAVDKGGHGIEKIEIPSEWKNISSEGFKINSEGRPDFIKNICDVMNSQNGDNLPVSAFVGREDGSFPQGTTAYEKRGVAVSVPEWIPETCIQCNQCAYVCPHAAIRPFLVNPEEEAKLPGGTKLLNAIGKGLEGHKFKIQVSVLDCTGCGNCVDVCPAPKGKALEMKHLGTQMKEATRWDHFAKNITYKDDLVDKFSNVKSSQFAQPLFEFSGACAGCGETPYVKLLTQLYGDRMYIANATGCSSIYGGTAPTIPFCKNKNGFGPTWANSLFEDNAEYGYGMALAVRQKRTRIEMLMNKILDSDVKITSSLEILFKDWIENKKDADKTKELAPKLVAELSNEPVESEILDEIYELSDYFIMKSVWILGGDGWAYDIG
ncbi:MAG: 2-oxoacid:acceptor oxidoreductase family protein, partial [Candidatus Delongbacteria bacterium]|nr:2-oxoacid:acceptor oxidoreductase family protein [Candidatus Delongbacteria bacterium]